MFIIANNLREKWDGNRLRLTTLTQNYHNSELMLKKETAFMYLMKLAKLPYCVEILGFPVIHLELLWNIVKAEI